MARVFVRFGDDVQEFASREAAAESILSRFAETGTNEVEDAWEQEGEGDEKPLSLSWSVKVEEP